MTNIHTQITKLISSLPLSRLSTLQREINSYHSKWDTEKVIKLVDLSIIEDFYTVLQYLNRAASVVGASTYLAGEVNENNIYKKIGGSVAVVSLYVDFLASYGKEKLFKPEERKKKWDNLISDTENLQDCYQELVEILESIYISDSLGKLDEVINSLKEKTNEVSKKNENGNIREFSLLKDGPSESMGIKQRFGRLFSSKRHLLENWKKWGDEWEKRRNKQEEVKLLIKILKIAISKYQQGISENEIESEIEKKMIELRIDSGKIKIIKESSQVSKVENANDNSCSSLLNQETEVKIDEIKEELVEIPSKQKS